MERSEKMFCMDTGYLVSDTGKAKIKNSVFSVSLCENNFLKEGK